MGETRLYISGLKGNEKVIDLSEENSNIVRKVLRLKIGSYVEVINGHGLLGSCTISSISKNKCQISIEGFQRKEPPYKSKITLLQAYPKAKRIEVVVQKMTELGIDRIIFFQAERSVPFYKNESLEGKIQRLRRIMLEALRQSQRLYEPELMFASRANEAISLANCSDLNILMHEAGAGRESLMNILVSRNKANDIVFAIGPEGGFSDEEVGIFVDAGFVRAKLGEEILRTETAPIAVISILNYQYRW
jgi:16S rRNA (uracil1498-N3)-methyltransferase